MQIKVDQVLLFLNPGVSEELGRALWAAMEEVEAFYNFDDQRVVFRRIYLSEHVPDGLKLGYGGFSGLKLWLNKLLGWDNSDKNASASKEEIFQSTLEDKWQEARGKYSRTYDARKIVATVRKILADEELGNVTIIVTDQELTPPPDWRYVIWAGDTDGGIVISTVPTDPKYWRMSDPHPASIIKHRVRTSCLQIVGRMLGLDVCENERCFLFQPVDSVLRLDHMVELGSEHKIEALANRGYKIRVNDPGVVQSIEKNPEPEPEEY